MATTATALERLMIDLRLFPQAWLTGIDSRTLANLYRLYASTHQSDDPMNDFIAWIGQYRGEPTQISIWRHAIRANRRNIILVAIATLLGAALGMVVMNRE